MLGARDNCSGGHVVLAIIWMTLSIVLMIMMIFLDNIHECVEIEDTDDCLNVMGDFLTDIDHKVTSPPRYLRYDQDYMCVYQLIKTTN